jgi:hypothetical protein
LLAGAVKATVAVEEPVAVAAPIVGAPGTIAATALVAFELAETAATTLVAVTTHRIALPASAFTNTYVLDVALPILEPARCHWYVNVGVGAPVQVPLVVLKVCPTVAVPDTTGATVLMGAEL